MCVYMCVRVCGREGNCCFTGSLIAMLTLIGSYTARQSLPPLTGIELIDVNWGVINTVLSV